MGRKAKVLLILYFCIVLVGATSPNRQLDSKIYTVNYHLTVEPSYESIFVTMTIQNYPADSLSLWTHKAHPDPINMYNFAAISVDSQQINAQDIKCIGWDCEIARIQNGAHRNFTVTYTIQPGVNQENPADIYQAGIITSDYMVFSGYSVFAVPNRYEPTKILITYSLPDDQDWEFYSVWNEEEAGLNPKQGYCAYSRRNIR